ncbi:MAG: AAA family ATPase [Polyangia bacterium]
MERTQAVYASIWQRMSRGHLNLGRNRPKICDLSAQARITFADVAGVDKAVIELVRVVEFLESPARFNARLDASIPPGVLLMGPPGTGKTLLAHAVAGEANVPLFSLSGSEFGEAFVGMGAACMGDLFKAAQRHAPCIVFIDELDGIGQSPGGLAALSRLLAELDSVDPNRGVIIMAATNRPEALEEAVVRPGRFDHLVWVDRPDLQGREAILRLHVRGRRLANSVDIRLLAQRTLGMVGRDLAEVVKEAALVGRLRCIPHIESEDFEDAVGRVQLGLLEREDRGVGDARPLKAQHAATATVG